MKEIVGGINRLSSFYTPMPHSIMREGFPINAFYGESEMIYNLRSIVDALILGLKK